MDLRNCRDCGRMIQYPGFGPQLCPQCSRQLDKKFKDVKEYLKKNPRTTITELSDAMEVPIVQINQWIREERLTFSQDSPIGIDCEGCGKMIKSGRYCKDCKNKMINQFGNGKKEVTHNVKKTTADTRGRMRYLDNK